ncbi:hypothetical protein [Rhizobium bangladeshense]|uniref:hypothetical protein n=1 Tax=Rhizobium bangladeshense TaxID=1138189 RepID=UPI001C8331DA|nr:hypothetical protein [Rhizobium bangladeshense]MBX4912935.1 hypothetical protein [Rhizobium bangladeshense]
MMYLLNAPFYSIDITEFCMIVCYDARCPFLPVNARLARLLRAATFLIPNLGCWFSLAGSSWRSEGGGANEPLYSCWFNLYVRLGVVRFHHVVPDTARWRSLER